MEPRRAVVQLRRPGRDDRDDAHEATAASEVELGGRMNADANTFGDGSGHGGDLREEVI